ncbi:hypothetical protein MtrunA17_Chr6g0471671 [Medicago truncatula]|uniref:Transmembrane protein, putative n=1 Tax=Medicago truncatula TaxID=3880 RepID=A0A072UAI8_MEDTR|nr:transmembrane protein, putative [Medicago truncatula]RHN51695.1 hypothetical protein MtrunA17_Chr6g0471671 [Medicago truncatula]
MREKTVNQVIANISTNNAILQIVLILILFGQVTYAWNWNNWLNCLGATLYTITIEKLYPGEINIECYSTDHSTKIMTYKKNETFFDFTFCGLYDWWFGETAPWYCFVYTNSPTCESGVDQKAFEVFNENFDCAKEKEAYCEWRLHPRYPILYNPKKKILENRFYNATSCFIDPDRPHRL